jgi:hypothetical protein
MIGRGRLATIALGAMFGSVILLADDMSVNFDPGVDFSAFKTFKMRERMIESPRPELDNSLFLKMLERTIERTLRARGMTQADSLPDLFIDFRITGEDVSTTRRGTSMVGINGRPVRGMSSGPQAVRYTSATLVIDLIRPGDPVPIWRGVYRDDEGTGSKLVRKLPEDAKKLLAKYPPKK